MPTFVYFHKQKEIDRVRGATPEGIYKSLQTLAKKAPNATRTNGENNSVGGSSSGSNSSSSNNSTADDIKEILNKTKFELLNDVLHFGEAEILNVKSVDPSADLRNVLDVSNTKLDSVIESDADSQILIYLPLQNKAKVHSIYIKSTSNNNTDSDVKQPPSTIKVWANLPSIISFDDATDGGIKPLHHSSITTADGDWHEINLRYVLFQNVTSLQIFLDGDDEDASTTIQKILIVGSKGENRDQGKIEKID